MPDWEEQPHSATTYSQIFLPNIDTLKTPKTNEGRVETWTNYTGDTIIPCDSPLLRDAHLPFSQPEALVGITPTRRPSTGLQVGSRSSTYPRPWREVGKSIFLGSKLNQVFDTVYSVCRAWFIQKKSCYINSPVLWCTGFFFPGPFRSPDNLRPDEIFLMRLVSFIWNFGLICSRAGASVSSCPLLMLQKLSDHCQSI